MRFRFLLLALSREIKTGKLAVMNLCRRVVGYRVLPLCKRNESVRLVNWLSNRMAFYRTLLGHESSFKGLVLLSHFTIAATLFLVLLAPTAQAGPIDFFKRQFRDHPVRTRFVTTAIAGAIYAEGLHQCRLVNVENCDAHYGAAWGSYAATMGLDVVGQIVGYKIGGKTGDAISYGGSAGVLAWGAYQWNGGLNKPPERKDNETSKVDLSHVSFIRY